MSRRIHKQDCCADGAYCRVSERPLSGGGGKRQINGPGRGPKGNAGLSHCGGGSRLGACRKGLSKRIKQRQRLATNLSSTRKQKDELDGDTGNRTFLPARL